MTGNVLSQLVLIITAPLITRFYLPEDFAVYAAVMTIVNMTNVLTTLRLERGILICNNIGECKCIISFIKLTFIFYILISFVIYFLIVKFINLPNNLYLKTFQEFGLFALILSIIVGIEFLLYHLNLREDNFKNISKTKIINSIFQTSGQALLGFLSIKNGLFIATIFASLLKIIILYKKLKHSYFAYKIKKFYLAVVIKKNISIIKYLVPGSFITSLISSILIIYCSIFIDASSIGLIYLSQKILVIPLGLIIRSASDVNFKEFSSKDNDDILYIYKSRIRKTFFFSIIPFLLIFLLSPYAFSFIFGEIWVLSGYYSQILLPGLFVQLLYSPFGNIFWVKKANGIFLLLSLARLFLLIVGMQIGYNYYALNGVLYGYSISLISGYVLQNYMIKYVLKKT